MQSITLKSAAASQSSKGHRTGKRSITPANNNNKKKAKKGRKSVERLQSS